MKVMKLSDVQLEDRSEAPLFRGGKVNRQCITDEQPGKPKGELSTIVVNFGPGAGTKFHTHHDSPQILYVTKGKGKVATEKEEVIVTPGTFVIFEAGEKHMHGATEDSDFSHISIMIHGETSR